jgi:hypothetical protein
MAATMHYNGRRHVGSTIELVVCAKPGMVANFDICKKKIGQIKNPEFRINPEDSHLCL